MLFEVRAKQNPQKKVFLSKPDTKTVLPLWHHDAQVFLSVRFWHQTSLLLLPRCACFCCLLLRPPPATASPSSATTASAPSTTGPCAGPTAPPTPTRARPGAGVRQSGARGAARALEEEEEVVASEEASEGKRWVDIFQRVNKLLCSVHVCDLNLPISASTLTVLFSRVLFFPLSLVWNSNDNFSVGVPRRLPSRVRKRRPLLLKLVPGQRARRRGQVLGRVSVQQLRRRRKPRRRVQQRRI